jgi:hypothetical protein
MDLIIEPLFKSKTNIKLELNVTKMLFAFKLLVEVRVVVDVLVLVVLVRVEFLGVELGFVDAEEVEVSLVLVAVTFVFMAVDDELALLVVFDFMLVVFNLEVVEPVTFDDGETIFVPFEHPSCVYLVMFCTFPPMTLVPVKAMVLTLIS